MVIFIVCNVTVHTVKTSPVELFKTVYTRTRYMGKCRNKLSCPKCVSLFVWSRRVRLTFVNVWRTQMLL